MGTSSTACSVATRARCALATGACSTCCAPTVPPRWRCPMRWWWWIATASASSGSTPLPRACSACMRRATSTSPWANACNRCPSRTGCRRDAHAEPLTDVASPAEQDVRLSLRLIPYSDELWLLVARDVTKLMRLEQMRRDFVANVSHELRTPLTVVHGYLEMLDPAEQPEWAPMLAEMQRQSQPHDATRRRPAHAVAAGVEGRAGRGKRARCTRCSPHCAAKRWP